MKKLIKVVKCNLHGAWYENHMGENFSAYREITYNNEPAYMVRAFDGYSNVILKRDVVPVYLR